MKLVRKPAFFSYLPSKKFAAIIFLLALSVALFYLGKFVKIKPNSNASLKSIINQRFGGDFAKMAENLDSDNDGLRDWEEVLWRTDINNQDTDNDGYSDKQEADAGYDPADPTSSEKTGRKGKLGNLFAESDIIDSVNLTENMAKNAGKGVAESITGERNINYLEKTPLSLLGADMRRGIAEFIASFNIRIPVSELKMIDDNSPETITNYLKEINKILADDYFSKNDPEKVITSALRDKNFEGVDNLITICNKFAADLKNTPVPSEFSATHKRFVELMVGMRRVFESVREIEADPLKTVIGLQQGERINQEIMNLTNNFSNLIAKYNR